MMTEFRALCAELADAYLRTLEHINNSTWLGYEPSDDPLLQRARASLADEPPEPAPPADGEVAELVEWLQEEADDYECIGCEDSAAKCKRVAELLERQVLVPVSVSERLPGPEVCVPHPRTKRGNWCWGFERCEVSLARPARWRLMHMEAVEMEASHWLPAHALPLPEVGE
jgi:hypothetical protein